MAPKANFSIYFPSILTVEFRSIVVAVVDFYFTSQGQTGNGAQFYGSEFEKGESYGEREREREREREGGGGWEGREGDDKHFCSVNRAILQCQ